MPKIVYAAETMHVNCQIKVEYICIYTYIYIYGTHIYIQGLDWAYIAHIYVYIAIYRLAHKV